MAPRLCSERQHLVSLYRFQRLLQAVVISRALPHSAAWLCPPAQKGAWQQLAQDLEASIDALREAYRALLARDAAFRQLVAEQPAPTAGPEREAYFYRVLAPQAEELARPYRVQRDAALALCRTTRQAYARLLRAGPADVQGEGLPLPAPEQLRIPHRLTQPVLWPPLLATS